MNTWGFTEAVCFWTEGKHANHGFVVHGDVGDWVPGAPSRQAKEIRDRPMLRVMYEPGK